MYKTTNIIDLVQVKNFNTFKAKSTPRNIRFLQKEFYLKM